MTQRPSEYLQWVPTGDSNKVLPAPANLRVNGWGLNVRPPYQYSNWQIWLLDQWIQYLDAIISTGVPNQVMRLLDGGEWSFHKDTGVFAWSQDAHLSIAGIPDANNIIPAGSAVLTEGQIAYVTVNPPIILLGDIESGSNIVLNVNFTENLVSGMAFTGPGIPIGTTIFAVGDSTLTLSQNATATTTATQLIACATGNLTVTVIDEESWIPTLVTILIAKRLNDKIYMGVNSTEMVLIDNEFKTFMGMGYVDSYDVVAGENLTHGENVYVSPGPSTDVGRTLGAIYKLDCSADWREIRGIFAGTVASDVTTGNTVTVVYNGFFKYSGLTPGKTYWADPTVPGGKTVTKPTDAGVKRIPIGFSVTTTNMIIVGTGDSNNDFDYSQPIIKPDHFGTGDGVTQTFSLSTYPLNADSLFMFVDGLILNKNEYVLNGKDITFNDIPAPAQELYALYVLAGQNHLVGAQEEPISVGGSTTIFSIVGQPVNQDALSVFIDGIIVKKADYDLAFIGTTSQITLHDAKDIAQEIYCFYLSPLGFNGSSAGITNLTNLGTGIGLFVDVLSNVARIKSLKAGTGVTLVDSATEITISAPSTGGGLVSHGTMASPVEIDPAVGILNYGDQRQLQIIESQGGEQVVSANPQIAPGTTLGQEMILKGTSDINYPVLNDGSGVSLNGSINLKINSSLYLFWDSINWCEIGRR
jgi:hypothetical protein